MPVGARRPGQQSTLKYFMDSLHPYVAFAVLPLFVLTAAGVAMHRALFADLAAPVPLAILAALAIGKPVGVFGLCAAGIGLKLVRRPMGARWSEIGAVSILTGVSIAVGSFAAGVDIGSPAAETAVLLASLLSALVGGVLSRLDPARSTRRNGRRRLKQRRRLARKSARNPWPTSPTS